MQSIPNNFETFSYHEYIPPVDSTEECSVCMNSLAEESKGVKGAVAHNDLNPRKLERQEHLHKIHKGCLDDWIAESTTKLDPWTNSTLQGRIKCPECRENINFRSFFPDKFPDIEKWYSPFYNRQFLIDTGVQALIYMVAVPTICVMMRATIGVPLPEVNLIARAAEISLGMGLGVSIGMGIGTYLASRIYDNIDAKLAKEVVKEVASFTFATLISAAVLRTSDTLLQ